MTMQPSIFRRNYYLIRVHSREQLRKEQIRERQVYSETARVVNQMITHIKHLLFKANSLKQELQIQSQKDSSSQGQDCEDIMEGFKQFQKQIPLTFFSQYPLDNKMLGAFVMRMSKQISYWTKPLPYLFEVVEDIDKVFQEQKNNQNQNISLVYFITVKKIINQTNQFFKKIKFNQAKPKQIETKIIILSQHLLIQNKSHQINLALNLIYGDLDIELQQSLYHQIPQLQANFGMLCKRQIKRNKKMKKQIKLYKLAYQNYTTKKVKDLLKKKKVRKYSNTKSNSKTKPKDSHGSNFNILLPSINNSQQRVLKVSKKAKEQNKASDFSFQKPKKKTNTVKMNKVQLKLKL